MYFLLAVLVLFVPCTPYMTTEMTRLAIGGVIENGERRGLALMDTRVVGIVVPMCLAIIFPGEIGTVLRRYTRLEMAKASYLITWYRCAKAKRYISAADNISDGRKRRQQPAGLASSLSQFPFCRLHDTD